MKKRRNGNELPQLERSPATWEWPRIAVFVPMMSSMSYADELFPYFVEIARTGVSFIYHPCGLIDSVRNRIAEGMLVSDFTHVLMLDADQKHPIDIVPRLARWAIEKPERLIIAGLYFNRRSPYAPNAWAKGDDGFYYQIHKWDQGALIEGIDLVGTGCLLVNKKVFDIIERPWFFFDYEGVKEKKGDFVYPGEDIGFCKKARAAGIEICLDTTVDSPHACTSWVNEKTYRSHCAMNEEANEGVIDYEQFKELA